VDTPRFVVMLILVALTIAVAITTVVAEDELPRDEGVEDKGNIVLTPAKQYDAKAAV
jgi:hypothetical protein